MACPDLCASPCHQTLREGVLGRGALRACCAAAQAWLLMFDSVDTVNDCIRIATGVLSTIAINPQRMLAGLSADMLATDLAEYLVRKGAQEYSIRVSYRVGPC